MPERYTTFAGVPTAPLLTGSLREMKYRTLGSFSNRAVTLFELSGLMVGL